MAAALPDNRPKGGIGTELLHIFICANLTVGVRDGEDLHTKKGVPDCKQPCSAISVAAQNAEDGLDFKVLEESGTL